MVVNTAEIGIFGGTGIYDSEILHDSKEITIETPYGKTSDTITIGELNGKKLHLCQDMEKNTLFLHI